MSSSYQDAAWRGAFPTAEVDPVSVEDRLITVEKKIDEILSFVKTVLEKMEKVETMTGKVIEEVKPTIDELMNSSLFKMLGVKKK